MSQEFWHEVITDKSFTMLQTLRKIKMELAESVGSAIGVARQE